MARGKSPLLALGTSALCRHGNHPLELISALDSQQRHQQGPVLAEPAQDASPIRSVRIEGILTKRVQPI